MTAYRRESWPVKVGRVTVGGDAPIAIQSMTSTSTMDTEGSAQQSKRIAEAGGDIVRLTAQGVREAANLGEIKKRLRELHLGDVPLVADIHFNPRAAFEAARHVEKVRINPGNFVDPGRTFKHLEYTDEEYAAEQERIADTLVPFLELCREHGTAVRIGVNHGSLSDRIMSRYGNTPAGMAESAMEFLRIAVKNDFKDIVISMKASNTVVMVESVRRLVAAMDREGMHFPLHLGVTEAGEGTDGRIKSAVGIGTLLAHGMGDTIRVSLSEDPECEVPVARDLVKHVVEVGHIEAEPEMWEGYDRVTPSRFPTRAIGGVGGDNPIYALTADGMPDADMIEVEASGSRDEVIDKILDTFKDYIVVIRGRGKNQLDDLYHAIARMRRSGVDNPIIARLRYDCDPGDVVLKAASDVGALLLDRMADGIDIGGRGLYREANRQLELDILQAARCRFSKTEFISCPGCGRTLFDLQSSVGRVKSALSHLKGLKIAVMGCIVNGPGEMADADYGYVGAAAGKVSLYRGKECVERNIPQEEALEALINMLKNDGKWYEPETTGK